MTERRILDQGLDKLGLDLPEQVREQLLAYLQLLVKWNKAYNLTAVRDPQQMVTRHLLDSLAVVPYLPAGAVIDVGTGGGLPGIPLALVCPDNRYTLLDSNSKKTRFLNHVKLELGLSHLTVVHSRVEAYRPEAPYKTVITRAFASLPDMLNGSRHLLAPDGAFLAMKGVVPEEELATLSDECRVDEIIPLRVPGLEQEQRHLIRIVCGGA